MYTSTDDELRNSDPMPADPGPEDDSQVVEEASVAAISPNEAIVAAGGTLAGRLAAAYEADNGRKLVKTAMKTDPDGPLRSLGARRRLV